jgi:hypothetical protein
VFLARVMDAGSIPFSGIELIAKSAVNLSKKRPVS